MLTPKQRLNKQPNRMQRLIPLRFFRVSAGHFVLLLATLALASPAAFAQNPTCADFEPVAIVNSGCVPGEDFELRVRTETALAPFPNGVQCSWALPSGAEDRCDFLVTAPNPGAYIYTLTVTLPDGTVCPSQTRTLNLVYLEPDFTYTPDPICEPDVPVSFTATPAGQVNYNWTSGAINENRTDPQWSRSFPNAGDYRVTLTATNDIGCEVPVTKTVTVLPRPLRQPPVDQTVTLCADPGETVRPVPFSPDFNFPEGDDLDPGSISWTFPTGDPATSADMEPTVVYPAGQHNYSLSYRSTNGCEYTFNGTVEVVIVERPDLEIISPAEPACPEDTITLETNPPAATLAGDLNWSEGPEIVANEGGVFDVTLEYIEQGCTTTATGEYSVVNYNVDFKEIEWEDRYICDLATETPSDFEIIPKDPETPLVPGLEFSWEFYQHQGEDQDSVLMTPDFPTDWANDQNFSYAFTEDNTEYTVVLKVRGPSGKVCPIEKVQWIVIANPVPEMTMSPQTICLWQQIEIEGGAEDPAQHDLNIKHHVKYEGVEGQIAGTNGNIIVDTTTGYIDLRPVGPDGGPFRIPGRYRILYEISNNKKQGEDRCPTEIELGFVDVVGVNADYDVTTTLGCPPLEVEISEVSINVYPDDLDVAYSEWQLEGGTMDSISPAGWEQDPLNWTINTPADKRTSITIEGAGAYNFALTLTATDGNLQCDTTIRNIVGESILTGIFPLITQNSAVEGCPGDSIMLLAANEAEEPAIYEWYSTSDPPPTFLPDFDGNNDTIYCILPDDNGVNDAPDEDIFEVYLRATGIGPDGELLSNCSASTEETTGNPYIVTRLGADFDFFEADGIYYKECAPKPFRFVTNYNAAQRYGWGLPGSEEGEIDLDVGTNEQNVMYNQNGLFDVSLTVEDEFGCVITRTKEEYVEVEGPTPEISFVQDQWCGVGPIRIQNDTPDLEKISVDYNMGSPQEWDLPEVGILEYDQLSYEDAAANIGGQGGDTIQIRVQSIKNVNGLSCTAKEFYALTILPEANFDFSLPQTPLCAPLEFTPVVAGGEYTTNWTMPTENGDFTSTERAPLFSIPAPPDPTSGPFEDRISGLIMVPITVNITTPDGCPGEITKMAPVGVRPEARFTHALSDDCVSGLLVFRDDGSSADPNNIAPIPIGQAPEATWDFGNGEGSDQLSDELRIQYAESGAYDVSLVVENRHGCADTASERVVVDFYGEGASLTSSPEAAPNVIFFPPEPRVTFTDSASGVISWKWTYGDGSPDVVLPPPVEHVYPAKAGEYDVRVERTFENSCMDTLQLRILVKSNINNTPSIFTPNGDGINDFWTIPQGGSETYSLRVYDRWGQLIKTIPASEANIGWDGNFNGNPVPEGVYFYQLELDGINRSGSITVVR